MPISSDVTIIVLDQDKDLIVNLQVDAQKIFDNHLKIYSPLTEVNTNSIENNTVIPIVILSAKNQAYLETLKNKFKNLENSYEIILDDFSEYSSILTKHPCESTIKLSRHWEFRDLRNILKTCISKFLLKFHFHNLSQYENIISHKQYMEALKESEDSRQNLSKKLDDFCNIFFGTPQDINGLVKDIVMEIRKNLTEEQIAESFLKFSAGATLLRENSKNEHLWFLINGEVSHSKKNQKGQMEVLFTENNFSLIGLISFLTSEPTLTEVTAESDIEVVKVDKKFLNQIADHDIKFLSMFLNLTMNILSQRIKTTVHQEIKFKQMIHQLEQTQNKMIESEKFVMLGQLVSGISHELNNPAAAILRSTEHLKNNLIKILSNSNKSYDAQGIDLMREQEDIKPLSSALLREQTKQLEPLFSHDSHAKKAAKMGLDKSKIMNIGKKTNNYDTLIEILEPFYQVGTFLRNIHTCGQRIANLVEGLRNNARPSTQEKELANIESVIADSLIILSERLKSIEVIKEYEGIEPFYFFKPEMHQVFINLISNAAQALRNQANPQVKIVTSTCLRFNRKFARIVIEDNGEGIAQEIQNKIFDLNFTTKKGAEFGLGLGLAITKKVVMQHAGMIELESRLGQYARFILYFPIS